MKKRILSLALCLSMLLGIVAGSGITVEAARTQPEVVGTTVSGWGAHNYVASDGSTAVKSELTANADGSITVSGNQVAAGMGIGVTNTTPIYLDESGFSIEFSFDKWDTTSSDVWFALFLSDRKTITNEENSDPVFKGWDNDGSITAGENRGLVLIMRPDGNGKLRFQWFYYGVTSNTDATPSTTDLTYVGDGCYDNVTLNSGNYEHIKLDFVRRADYGDTDGGYGIILNDGRYTRNGGDRVDGMGEITPAQKLKLLDDIFPTGTPMYVKLVASNIQNADTQLSVHTFNGAYANVENTQASWGLHNYTAIDGSDLSNTISSTDTGDIVIEGHQTAGEGELGVTYIRPVDMKQGFSIEFSLNEYVKNGVNGADSWVALQIKDKLTISDAANTNVYHKMDVGSGDPTYGSGLHILMRPGADNVLTIQEIYWCGLSIGSDGKPQVTKNWSWDANGCYSQIKLDSFEHIKISFIPTAGGGFQITFNDGDFEPVNNPNPNPGYINLANGYAALYQYFADKDAYVALSYKSNQANANAKMTVHAFNGKQASANTLDSWGIHNFVALDGSDVVTNAQADETGSLVLSGNQTAGDGAIGATFKRPIDLNDGFSIEFSLDEYSCNGTAGVDSWISLQLLRNEKVTDSWNPGGAYRHFEVGNPTYGDGLVMLIRPLENNRLGIGEIYINGAKVDGTVVSGAFNGVTNGGCYDAIEVPSFKNIKISIVPGSGGSFYIVFNDGDYVRVGADRWANDHGRINVAEGFSWFNNFFTDETPAYVKMAYKASSGVYAQFTIHKINGIAAVPAAEDASDMEVTDGVYELFSDTNFTNGFRVLGHGTSSNGDNAVGYMNYGNASLIPSWKVAQWTTKYDFRDLDNDTLFMELEDGVYQYDSIDKIFTVDTNTGTLGMELNASEVYESARKDGEAWPHLLIEGSTRNSEAPYASYLKNVDHLRLQLSHRLTMFEDHMNGEATGLHAASFYMYLYIKGTNEKGQTEMTWFGLTFFDNRMSFVTESGMQDGGKEDASGLFIYQVPSRAFTKTSFVGDDGINADENSAWVDIDIDLLPYVERALVLAQEKGFMKGVTMDTVYVDGMNMGWEMPGTYDAKMEVKNLSLKSYIGTDYSLNNGIYNLPVKDMQEEETVIVDGNFALNVPKNLVEMDGIDTSMLIIQSGKRPSTAGLSIENYEIKEAYDLGVWINGMEYSQKFDSNMEVVYTAPEGCSASDLKFFTISASGKAKQIEGVYDSEANTVTFTLNKAAILAIATEAAYVNPPTGDATGAAVCLAVLSALSICALLPCKRKER